MSRKAAIGGLRTHIYELAGLFGAELDELTELVSDLADQRQPADAWSELVMLVLRRLPSGHPVYAQFVSESFRSAQVADRLEWAAVAQEARLILAQLLPAAGGADGQGGGAPETDEIIASVHDRVLSAPARTPQELRSLGIDPDADGLLRLPAPDRGIRLPAFQFSASGAPFPVVLVINRMLGADRDRWAVADWWLSDNARLGTAPAGLLGGDADERLVGAARALRGRL